MAETMLNERVGWINTPKTRRVAIRQISAGLILQLMQAGRRWESVTPPLPEDARVVGVEYSAMGDEFLLVIESETFDEVEEGALPPYLPRPSITVSLVDDA